MRPPPRGAHGAARDALRPGGAAPRRRRARRVPPLKALFEGRFTPGRWVRAPVPETGADDRLDGNLGAAVERASAEAAAAAVRAAGADPAGRRLAYAFTEADAGSDAGAIRAAWDGAAVTGRKVLVAGAGDAEAFVVLARRDGRPDARLAALLVENGRRVTVERARPTVLGIGLRDVVFDAAPATLLGADGDGWRVAEAALGAGRAALAAAAVGAARRALDLARAAAARVRYGRPLGEHEAVADLLEEAADDLFAAEAAAADAARRGGLEAACAKVSTVEALERIADTAVRLSGGDAALADSPPARLAAEARALEPVFGPHDVVRAYVALAGVEAVRGYLRQTDEALRSVYGFLTVLPWYAVRRARLAFGVPRMPDVPREIREAARPVEEAAGILAHRAFDLAFRRRGLLLRAPRIQRRLGAIACETYAAACAVARADAGTEAVAWRVATRALDRVARESRRLEEALVLAEEEIVS